MYTIRLFGKHLEGCRLKRVQRKAGGEFLRELREKIVVRLAIWNGKLDHVWVGVNDSFVSTGRSMLREDKGGQFRSYRYPMFQRLASQDFSCRIQDGSMAEGCCPM